MDVLPDGYSQIKKIDFENDKKLRHLLAIFILIFVIVLILLLNVFIPFLFIRDLFDDIGMYMYIGFILFSSVLFIILNELILSTLIKKYSGKKAKYTFSRSFNYYHGSEAYFNKLQYLKIVLTPVILFFIIFSLFIIIVSVEWFWVIYILQIANFSINIENCFIAILLVLKMPDDVLIKDIGGTITIMSKCVDRTPLSEIGSARKPKYNIFQIIHNILIKYIMKKFLGRFIIIAVVFIFTISFSVITSVLQSTTEYEDITRPYDWYVDQGYTYDCMPSAAIMAAKWVDSDFDKSAAELRQEFTPNNTLEGWYVHSVLSFFKKYGVKYTFEIRPKTDNLINQLDNGNIIFVCINSYYISENHDDNSHYGKFYSSNGGHALILKGYEEYDGKTYFQVYDSASAGVSYEDGSLKGIDRYYLSTEIESAMSNYWNYAIVINNPKNYVTFSNLISN